MEPGSEPDGVPYPVATFQAFVNCYTNTLTIYPQLATWIQITNQSLRGYGTFLPVTGSSATITISDTVYSGSQVNSTNTFIIY